MTVDINRPDKQYIVDRADRFVAFCYTVAAGLAAAFCVLMSHPVAGGSISPGWALLGIPCSFLVAMVPLRRQADAAAVVVFCFCAAGTGWVWWGWAHDPFWVKDYWLALLGGVLIAGLTSVVFATPTDFGEPALQPIPVGPAEQPAVEPEPWSSEWLAKVTERKVLGVRDVEIVDWGTGCGYTVTGRMAADGSSWQTLAGCENRIAAALDLPHGGGVTVGENGGRNGWKAVVLTADAMAGQRPYPGLE